MATSKNRKLIQISTEAYEYLKKLRDAQERAFNYSLSLTNCASSIILSAPLPNGNGRQPMVTDLIPQQEEQP